MSKTKKTREELISQITSVILENATPETAAAQPELDTKNQTLRENLAQIRSLPGVTGYILKDQATAVFDMENSVNLMDYAMLASETFEAYATLTAAFELGEMENTLVECREAQMLCVTVDEASVAVFMEKNVDSKEIALKIQAQTKPQADTPK
jgi:predicted regulator of Ras-like GTPase activity (Roadblock/LC7/MglB family)